MQHPPRAARNEHLPRGRQSKVCLILVLLAVWILPPMVATAGDTDLPRLISHNAPADPGDENWVSGFNVSGMNSTVHALAVGPDGSLYAGGAFSTAGGTPANYIARWDGSAWRSLGSGLNERVNTLTFGPDGSLYAGGSFSMAGGVAARNIARWDGAAWHPLGSGLNGAVYALAVGPDGSIFAGGTFSAAGGAPANHIARWDGVAWHPLGSGMDIYIYALAVGPGGSLYAGGNFTTAGGVAANAIARWDGTAWHPLGSGMSGDNYLNVRALAFGADGSLYAGGDFTAAGGVTANSIARWDGTAWHALGDGMSGHDYRYVDALAFGPDGSLYAGGDFTAAGGVAANSIARWDGTSWHPLGSGMNSSVYALAIGLDGSLYLGGWFTAAGGIPSSYIARWKAPSLRRHLPLILRQ